MAGAPLAETAAVGLNASLRESTDENDSHHGIDPGFGGRDVLFIVLADATVWTELGECALGDPAARLDREPDLGGGTCHGLDCPSERLDDPFH